MIWFSLALNFAGLAALMLSMKAHHAQVLPQPPTRRQQTVLRAIGVVLQLLSLSLAVKDIGVGIGLIEWIAGWAACGFTLTLLLAISPRWIAWPARLLPLGRSR